MLEMNPYYAHQSPVGPVFDVATWSRRKTATMAVAAAVFAVLAFGTLTLAWRPTVVMAKPPKVVKQFHKETLKLKRDHAWAAIFGSGVGGVLGWFGIAATSACLLDVFGKDQYYFRVGAGGISLCVPHGVDFSKLGLVFKHLELHLPFSQIADWQVVQHRQVGSMSRNAGNTMAFLKLRTTSGKKQEFNLDCFREPASVIHSKINDAMQMVPLQPDVEATSAPPSTPVVHASSLEDKCDAILDALTELTAGPGADSAVIFSDTSGGNFVQFARKHGSVLCDLPRQALDGQQQERAESYFARLGGTDMGTAAAGTITVSDATGQSFRAECRQVEQAARLALEVFRDVYQLPDDFPMTVETV